MPSNDSIPLGLCQCGCGRTTTRASKTNARRGVRKGDPLRFFPGHGSRTGGRPYYAVDDETGCWVWQRSVSGEGYARITIGGKTVSAHRWYYEQRFGSIPEGYELDHTCRNRACVNPDHLEPVTGVENIRRGDRTHLTMDDARAIRALRGKAFQRELAARFAVDQTTISRIQLRKVWRE